MNAVTLVRRYGLWLVMAALVSLQGTTMSGCLSEPPAPAAGSSAVEQSIQGDLSTVTGSPVPLSCPPCSLARGQLAAGSVIGAACDCSLCGDGICNNGETHATCSPDCPLGPVCGNGRCEAGETASSCPRDCGVVVGCGNGICEAGEPTSCPQDCCGQATPPCTL
jgi:hypothetical protein